VTTTETQAALAELRRAHAAVQATEEMYRAASRRRELAVARLFREGRPARQIARDLGLRHQTVMALLAKGLEQLDGVAS
jgi:DNA-binding NarL/FixJ family response regulator